MSYDLNRYILVNSRKIAIKAILEDKVEATDQEEKALFSFCKNWLSDNKAFTQKTSGSTGTPKEIMITREKMCYSAGITSKFLGLTSEDVCFVCLSVNYIAGKMMLVRAFENDQQIVFQTPSANPILELTTSVDFVALVPYQLKNAIENKISLEKLNNIKHILVGGASIDFYLENLIKNNIRSHIYHTFGMTETVSHIALRDLKSPIADYVTVGDVIIGQDQEGCLTVQSQLTDGVTLTTSDLVKITSPTTFQWKGRKDNIINSGGIKIQIEQLEREIYLLMIKEKLSRRIIVTSKPHEGFGQVAVLLIEGEDWDTGFLDKTCKDKMIKEIHFISAFVETPTQKIDRKATAALLA